MGVWKPLTVASIMYITAVELVKLECTYNIYIYIYIYIYIIY